MKERSLNIAEQIIGSPAIFSYLSVVREMLTMPFGRGCLIRLSQIAPPSLSFVPAFNDIG
ncbi:MAG: hypothetical protein HY537_16305 [Deltaproteobacteria bacterium]|nr:hypothetical protein [Deltaproteobacteria bacterium]